MAINSPILNLAKSLRQAKKTGLRKSAGNFLKANSPAVAAVSGAINFIRGDRSGLSDTIDNISTPIEERQEQNRTNFKSNFMNNFGSKRSEKQLQKNMKLFRNVLADTFESATLLVSAIKRIGKALKGMGGGSGGFGGGGLIKALLGAGLVGILLERMGVPIREMISDTLSPYMPALKTLLIAGPLLTALIALKKPKLASKLAKKGALPFLATAGTVSMFGDGTPAMASEESTVNKFQSVVDRFSAAIDSLVAKKTNLDQVKSEVATKIETVKGDIGKPGPIGATGADGITTVISPPKREDYPNTRGGAKQYIEAKKEYVRLKSTNFNSTINNLSKSSRSNINIIPFNTGGVQPAPSQDRSQIINPNLGRSSGVAPAIPFVTSTNTDSYGGFESKMLYNITD